MAMGGFDFEDFMNSSSWDKVIDSTKKDDWINLAWHFNTDLQSHPSEIIKIDIKVAVLNSLMEEGLLGILDDPQKPSKDSLPPLPESHLDTSLTELQKAIRDKILTFNAEKIRNATAKRTEKNGL